MGSALVSSGLSRNRIFISSNSLLCRVAGGGRAPRRGTAPRCIARTGCNPEHIRDCGIPPPTGRSTSQRGLRHRVLVQHMPGLVRVVREIRCLCPSGHKPIYPRTANMYNLRRRCTSVSGCRTQGLNTWAAYRINPRYSQWRTDATRL